MIRYVSNRKKSKHNDRARARLERFATFYFANQKDEKKSGIVAKAWHQVAKSARDGESLVKFFYEMPDAPELQPFAKVYRFRNIDWREEKRRYSRFALVVSELVTFLADSDSVRPNLADLLRDCEAMGSGASDLFSNLRPHLSALETGLASLKRVLEEVDPKRKYLTEEPLGRKGAERTYLVQLTLLYLHLRNPFPHAAVAVLANINCSGVQVKSDTLKKAFARTGKRRTSVYG